MCLSTSSTVEQESPVETALTHYITLLVARKYLEGVFPNYDMQTPPPQIEPFSFFGCVPITDM